MITVNIDELFVSWLSAQVPSAGVASERPADLEKRLPFVVIRRGGGGDVQQWIDNPVMDVDIFASDWSSCGDLARAVDQQFRLNTPALWLGAQFTLQRCNQGAIKVGDQNATVRHLAATYTFTVI